MAGIFKAYDVRGVYPGEINEENAKKIGEAFARLKQGNIVIASDVRKSSPALKKSIMKGLYLSGARITDIGSVTTPMLIFATANYGFDAGLIITASHNPPQYNGVKFFDQGGVPISYEAGIKDIEHLVDNGSMMQMSLGKVEAEDIYNDYKNFLLSKLKIKNVPMKIVVDCFNGADSKVAPDILRALGATVIELRCGFNGDFPESGPDPSHAGNLDMLKHRVVQEKADIGFAYDGDGDRLAVVDSDGNSIEIRAIFSLLAENLPQGSKVVYDVLTSNMVSDSVKRNNNIPLVCRTGHTYITRKLLDEGAALGGELSGHFFFKETFGGDDALFASLKVLECMITKGIKLQDYVSKLPKYYSGDLRVLIKAEEKWNFVDKLKEEFSKSYKIDTLDGVKVIFDKGWAVFRASNTEPKISIAYESSDAQEFEKIKKIVEYVVAKIPK